MELFIKKFKQWSFLKKKIHYSEKLVPLFNEGEVWWCSLGVNIGNEIDGKNSTYTRPVLIFKKLSDDTFWGIPGTGQNKTGSWFISIPFQNKKQVFVLSDIRSLSSKRLDKIIGTLSEESFIKIKESFLGLLLKNFGNINPSVLQEGTREIPENLPHAEFTSGSSMSISTEPNQSTMLGDIQNNVIISPC